MARENLAGVAVLLEEALAPLLAADAVEIALDATTGELEVIAEQWTLHLEGWPERPLAWLAIDDEPDDLAQIPLVLIAILERDALLALTRVDLALGGGLAAALRAAGDPLSDELAAAIDAARIT